MTPNEHAPQPAIEQSQRRQFPQLDLKRVRRAVLAIEAPAGVVSLLTHDSSYVVGSAFVVEAVVYGSRFMGLRMNLEDRPRLNRAANFFWRPPNTEQ